MLTSHQSILIKKHLPEVVDVQDHNLNDSFQLHTIRLRLKDGSEIALVDQRGETRAYRSRLRDDYSDRVDVLPIEPDLRERLIAVFGAMTFRDPE